MHYRVGLVVLAGKAREIELAAGSASSESVLRVVLSCFQKCGSD
jgi:hypothetical protein